MSNTAWRRANAPSAFPHIVEVDESRCNLSNPQLSYDESCLLVRSTATNQITLLAQSSICEKCDLLEWTTVEPESSKQLIVKNIFPVVMGFSNSDNQNFCVNTREFGELGFYEINVTQSSCSDLIVLRQPDDLYFPLIMTLVVYLALWVVWGLLQTLLTSTWFKKLLPLSSPVAELENDLGSPTTSEGTSVARTEAQNAQRKQKARVKSLDTFRGICIALMIFVNYGGGKYWFFEHATWNGLTLADVLFPSFMWIMGLSMALAMRSQLRSGVSRRQVLRRVVWRGCKLILIGLVLNSINGKNSLPYYRLPGVLQRLGIGYIVVGMIEALRMPLQSPQHPSTRFMYLQDLMDAWLQWLLMAVIVVTHTLLTFLLPVPGCPTGYLGPGGLHNHGQYSNCTGGAAGWIDRVVLSDNHIYQHPTARAVYHTIVPFDPEGILGTLTSVVLVYFGVHAGRIMLTYTNPWSRLIRWTIWGIATGVIAGLLCNFSQEGGLIPVNKNLYSLSFILATAALDFVLLAILYLLVDMKHWWEGSPFYFTGMNSLFLYIGHSFTHNMFPWKWQPFTNTHAELIAMDAWGATVWVIIAFHFFRKNYFFTV